MTSHAALPEPTTVEEQPPGLKVMELALAGIVMLANEANSSVNAMVRPINPRTSSIDVIVSSD